LAACELAKRLALDWERKETFCSKTRKVAEHVIIRTAVV
jgi:hypothetical protein